MSDQSIFILYQSVPESCITSHLSKSGAEMVSRVFAVHINRT